MAGFCHTMCNTQERIYIFERHRGTKFHSAKNIRVILVTFDACENPNRKKSEAAPCVDRLSSRTVGYRAKKAFVYIAIPENVETTKES